MTLPDQSRPAAPPTPIELFLGFAGVSVSSFGGALPWARRMIVEQRKWMTAEEFNEAFSLSQFLPGPNLVNFSVVYGSRFGGPLGAVLALAGLLGPPLVIVTVLAALYARYGDIGALTRILGGIASAAAGLLIASVVKMLEPISASAGISRPSSSSSASSVSRCCAGRCLMCSARSLRSASCSPGSPW